MGLPGASHHFEFVELTADRAPAVREMTYATYRHLLTLDRQLRHPGLGGDRVDPFGVVAVDGDRPVGLALAEAPVESSKPAELLSVYVVPDARRRGMADGLVARMEREARRRRRRRLEAVFTTGKPGGDRFSELIGKRSWDEPRPECLVVHLRPSEALTSEVFSDRALRAFGRGIEVFPWADLTRAEEAEIRRSNRERRWIEPALEPWQFPRAQLDSSSVGGRTRGRVVGWILNHRLIPGFVRVSVGFMRGDLARRGKVVPLLYEMLRRVERVNSADRCSFITTFSYPDMIAFVRRRVAPVASFVGESRRSGTDLLDR